MTRILATMVALAFVGAVQADWKADLNELKDAVIGNDENIITCTGETGEYVILRDKSISIANGIELNRLAVKATEYSMLIEAYHKTPQAWDEATQTLEKLPANDYTSFSNLLTIRVNRLTGNGTIRDNITNGRLNPSIEGRVHCTGI